MKNLIKHVSSLNTQELLRNGQVIGRYKVGRERVDLTQVAFMVPETVCITAQIHKNSNIPGVQIQLSVRPVMHENEKCYALGYRTPYQSSDWIVNESGAEVFGRPPFMISGTERSNSISSLIVLLTDTSKRIFETNRVLDGLRG